MFSSNIMFFLSMTEAINRRSTVTQHVNHYRSTTLSVARVEQSDVLKATRMANRDVFVFG